MGAAKRAGPGSYLPGPRRLRAELGFRRDVGWGGGTGRGPWRRPGPGSVAPEPCLRRSRGLRVSGSGLGARDPPSPSRSHSPLPPKIAPCPYHRSASPPRGRSRQIQGCPPAPPKSHLPPKKIPPPSPPPQLPCGRGPFNRRLTDGSEWPMGGVVGACRWLNPASARSGRGRAGGERKAGLKERWPISARRAAAGAGGGVRQGDDVTWS